AALGAAGTAVVRWTAPADTGGGAITRYEIQILNAATNAQVGALRTAAPDAAQTTVTGVLPGAAYRFRVRAVNTAGAGAWSAPSNTVTPATVPGLPATVTVTSGARGGARTATIRWSAPAANGGSVITS